MGTNTQIEWTDHTFNPWRGCTKVSQGCAHCYAETMSARNPAALGEWGPQGTRVIAAEPYWKLPVTWDKAARIAGVRRRVFCASLADVFEGPETMPESDWPKVEAARERLFELIDATPHLDWLLLTKRPQNLEDMLPWTSEHAGAYRERFWPNVWIGTSVEDQATADERIPYLLRIPARVRFLSMEPLLGPVDLGHVLVDDWTRIGGHVHYHEHPALQWIIVGGESGAKARPMHPAWVRSLRNQTTAAGAAFFFKQWGEWAPYGRIGGLQEAGWEGDWTKKAMTTLDGASFVRVGKQAAGRLLDGRAWNEFPEVNQ
jgi:protein gp37